MGDSLDQAAIDALFNASKSQPDENAPVEKPEGQAADLGQSEIDALFGSSQGQSVDKPSEQKPEGQASDLGQNEIDALFKSSQGQSASKPSEQENAANSADLGQNEIDALFASSPVEKTPDPPRKSFVAPESFNLSAPVSRGNLTQAEVDAMVQPATGPDLPKSPKPVTKRQPQVAQPTAEMGQAEIDALFSAANETPVTKKVVAAAETPAQPTPLAGDMDQNEIDRLFSQGSQKEDATKNDSGLNQDEINFLLSRTELPVEVPAQESAPRQIPNSLDAPTISRKEKSRFISTRSVRFSSQLFGPSFFLPNRVEKRELVSQVLQKLFESAKSRTDSIKNSSDQLRPICSLTNRRGLKVSVSFAPNEKKPVHLRFSAVLFIDQTRKKRNIEQIVEVDQFERNEGVLASRWIDWFDTQFDDENLNHLHKCA